MLVRVYQRLSKEQISICSVRGGNIFGEHQVSSRESLADGAIEVAIWTTKQEKGLYNMDDFCGHMH